MWLSKQMKPETPTADADLGVTTITGDGAGGDSGRDPRSAVYGPGGYTWMPESGATVLVIKGGPGGEEQCVAGTLRTQLPIGMQPGEVCIQGPGSGTVYLRSDGTVELQTDQTLKLKGETVSIEGFLLINGEPYKPCEC